MPSHNFNIDGLTDEQVLEARTRYGRNVFDHVKKNGFIKALKDAMKEPMFILLVVAATIYFVTGNPGDGIFMSAAIVLVAAISVYQDLRSHNALQELKNLTQPHCKVIRNGVVIEIISEDIVQGDYVMVEEGTFVPADGTIIQSNDFSVNESILTGESFPVSKNETENNNLVYQGTVAVGGLAICRVVAIGNQTKLGLIGKSLEGIKEGDTPLQLQIRNFVKWMAIAGFIIFLVVWGINYYNSKTILDSFLKALTLAMSILPEEIPVAFTTFMALGAWRLMKTGVIVKQTKTVETLGSATVICVDKTGTITENKMALAKLFVVASNKISTPHDHLGEGEKELIQLAMWASEPIPFDPMEIALHHAYEELGIIDERPNYTMVHEFPLSGRPQMMTHIFQNSSGHRIIAAKGAPEALIQVSDLNEGEKTRYINAMNALASEGFRVLGVGVTSFDGNNFPTQQQQFVFKVKGLVAFYDPPKKNISAVFDAFNKAGIIVKILTGDNTATTTTIAKQIGLKDSGHALRGEEIMAMSEQELAARAMSTNVFTRMFPEAKLRIINALKDLGHIVAMTGDGVNDGPALKAAHIGIAMGKKGTEIAKGASSLILTEDDLAKMVGAVAMGRKIYNNLKKAIQYIISIHIPIILTVLIPLAAGWIYPAIFSPVHIILLELIMGPTCSIIYENEPIEQNAMLQKPRTFTNTFFNWRELITSIVQGLFITAGALFTYQFSVQQGLDENSTRTLVFMTLLSANIFLTLVNRSFYYSMLTTLRYKNNLIPIIIGVVVALTALLLLVPWLNRFFEFAPIHGYEFMVSMLAGFLSVIWFEGVKWFRRKKAYLLR